MTEQSTRQVVPVEQAVGMVLPHDITEIVKDTFKGRAFKKGHIIRAEDIDHLRRLGKEHVYVLNWASRTSTRTRRPCAWPRPWPAAAPSTAATSSRAR